MGRSGHPGGNNSQNFQIRVEFFPKVFERVEQEANTEQGVIFGGHGNQHFLSRRQTVDREQPKRWRAINQHKIIFMA